MLKTLGLVLSASIASADIITKIPLSGNQPNDVNYDPFQGLVQGVFNN